METSAAHFESAGFNRWRRCRHGNMVYNVNDAHIGRSLDLYGEWAEAELAMLGLFLEPGDVVIEAGANLGTHSVFFAGRVGPRGQVFAFEPQRIVHQLLCANLALNGLLNVHTFQAAAGAEVGSLLVPDVDFGAVSNYGGVSLNGVSAGARVPVCRLDDLPIDRCRLIKIDVEGMELEVLAGARALIARLRPMLYLENNDATRSAALIGRLQELGYQLFWHFSPFFNPRNFLENPDNVFGNLVDANMICVFPSQAYLFAERLPRALGPGDTAEAALARRQAA